MNIVDLQHSGREREGAGLLSTWVLSAMWCHMPKPWWHWNKRGRPNHHSKLRIGSPTQNLVDGVDACCRSLCFHFQSPPLAVLCLLKPSARLHISRDSLLHPQVLYRVQPERPRYSPNPRLSVFAWWRLHNYCGRLWLAQTYQWQQHQYFHEGKSRNFTSYLCWPCCLHLLNSLQIPVSSAVCKVAIERQFLNSLLIDC